MPRRLRRLASDPPPTNEPDPGEDLICHGGAWGGWPCGRRKEWVVLPCFYEGCPGYWAWRCPISWHGEPDDVLDGHGGQHALVESEARVEALYQCPQCGARDWRASGRWNPSDHTVGKFVCQRCGEAILVRDEELRRDRRA
jgi:predicted RNA-binding Zn-ribbon protein involved in translation (DUF1610 family)